MLPLIIGALGMIAYGVSEENRKPKAVKKMAKGGRVGQSGYAIMQRGELRTDAYNRVEFFETIEKALFKMSHVPFFKSLSKEEKLKLIVPYTKTKMAKGGEVDDNIIKTKYNSFVEKFANNETFIDKLKFNYKNNTHYFYVDIDVKSFYNEAKRYLRKNGWQITDEDVNKKNFIAVIPNKMAKGGILGNEGGGYKSKKELNDDFKRIIQAPKSLNIYEQDSKSFLGKTVKIKLPNEEKEFKTKVSAEYSSMIKGSGKYSKLYDKKYIVDSYAQGGNIETKIDALYKKSGFINDDYNWKSKLLEMLQDSSVEAYQIYQKLTAKQKKEVLQELFEMENDMGADGDEDIETSKENLSMFLSDSKNGKKY